MKITIEGEELQVQLSEDDTWDLLCQGDPIMLSSSEVDGITVIKVICEKRPDPYGLY